MVTSFVLPKCQFLKGPAVVIALSLSLVSFCANGDSAKINWGDFAPLSASTRSHESRQLSSKTPLSFVVDTRCAVKRLKTLRPGGVLNSVLARGASAARSGEEQSVGVELNSAVSFDLIEQEVAQEPCIKMAGYDGEVRIAQATITPASVDPGRPRQTYLEYIHFNEGIQLILPVLMIRKPVTIAVIDAGTDMSHPDLQLGTWRNVREIPGNGRDDDRNGFIDDVTGYNFGSDIGDPAPQVNGIEGSHGTHVAGLAAARWQNGIGITGVGGIAKIMAVNVFGAHRTTKSSVVENAIRYAARNGADVINMSLSGGEYSRTMSSALYYAVSRGSFVVSAAGNDGLKFESSPDSGVFYSPAAYGGQINGMITVTSVDTETAGLSRFSNFNPSIVQLAAPGAIHSGIDPVGLYSTFPGNAYSTLAGTSMAAPLVSGAAALVVGYLKACGLSSTPSQVESILIDGSSVNPQLINSVSSGRELNIFTLAQRLRALKSARCK